MYSRFFSKFSGAIIPHAGINYAGKARKVVFDNLNKNDKNIKYIIYIAALHNTSDSNQRIFILRRDKGFNNYFRNPRCQYEEKNLSNGAKKEHSFKWVESELNQYFKDAKILVLCPTPYSNLEDLSKDIIKFISKSNDKVLLFSTTDLIHYGKRFNNLNTLSYPQQLDKWRKEENLINDIVNINTNLKKKDLDLICGPYAIKTFMYVASYFKWNARVIDYYDSYGNESSLIDRYSIDFSNNSPEFVSYVSIIFGNFKKSKDILLPIDINLGLGIVKSIINAQLVDYNSDFYLPKWNNFHKMDNGIFVGTEIIKNNEYNTNASYGNYQTEDNNTNSAIKITKASKNCLNDARKRWKLPYSIENLDTHTFKVEILDDINTWTKYKSSLAPKKFLLDGNHGMLLTLNNGSGATYLPVVARDYKNKWTITDYMKNLSKKAGGLENDWKHFNSQMKIYKSISYKYDPNTNKIEVRKKENNNIRNHKGIIQSGGNKGRLKKGYKYSGKRLKNGLPQILKVKIKSVFKH